MAKAAGIAEGVTPTTLRHTFGSVLVMNAVPIAYVAAQFGHSDLAVTSKHYARWIPTESYATPPPLAAGEVPADLLTHLAYTRPTTRLHEAKTES